MKITWCHGNNESEIFAYGGKNCVVESPMDSGVTFAVDDALDFLYNFDLGSMNDDLRLWFLERIVFLRSQVRF